jgi:ribonuclease T2
MKRFRLACFALAIALFVAEPLAAQQFAQPGNFDFYVFTLSWSPQFCTHNSGSAECQVHGGNFVVHGLWPQWKSGSWPQNCSNVPGPANPNDEAGILADTSLVEHEWQRHGTCSGLSASGYFQLIQKVKDSIKIPNQFLHLTQTTRIAPSDIKSAFESANPQIKADGIAIGCAGNTLVQVQVCIAKDGTPTDCSGLRDCRASSIPVLPDLP